jgi:hypothetical protein
MSKYSKNRLYEEMEAEEYAEEEAYYQHEAEKRAKENKPKEEVNNKPKPKKAVQKQITPVAAKEIKNEEPEEYFQEKHVELETVDDWEAAMDALDAHVSATEAQKAAERAQKK